MKIALVKAPPTYLDWDKRPLLGIGYISSYLKANGKDTRIFDACFHSWSEREFINEIIEFNPDVIGFTAMTREIVSCSKIASRLRLDLDVPIIIGGCHVTALPERTLKEFPVFDYAVYGEGEKTALELVEFLDGNNSLKPADIAGLAFRVNQGNIHVNAPRNPLTSIELDQLPYPDLKDYYTNPGALADKDSYYVMYTSRGCPFKCAFCMRVMGNMVRQRSIENVIREMEYAICNYGAHTIDFTDDMFLFNDRRTRELLQLMIDKGLQKKVRWSGLTRANLITPELVNLAKKAGCFRIGLGVESGDNKVLKEINKGITIEQIKKSVKIIKDSGILVESYFIFGHPNETRETIKKSISLAAELNTHTVSFGLMVPFPGTEIYALAKKGEGGYRLLTEDWSEYAKYGGKVLELKNVTYKELTIFQTWAFVYFYLKNFRLLDAIRFFMTYKRGIYFMFKKIFIRNKQNTAFIA